MKMILDLFAGGHSVTLHKDSHVTTFTASADTDVQKNTDVTLTVEIASGYEVDEYEVIAGGVTVNPETKKFKMGEADVVIFLKTKANNLYMVTEETMVNVNDNPIRLHKNAKVVLTPNGVPKAIAVENGGTAITASDAVQNLIDQGILVKI